MYRRTFVASLGLAVIAVAATVNLASAQRAPGGRPGTWELLGTQKVGYATDRDVIRVGRQEGRYKAIKLRVRGNAIEMLDLKVVYANGQQDDLQVRSQIRAGGETRAIDLKGERRAIQEVQMVYKSRPNYKGQATVEVYGQH